MYVYVQYGEEFIKLVAVLNRFFLFQNMTYRYRNNGTIA